MHRSVIPLFALLVVAACQDRSADELPASDEATATVTAPASPSIQPNAPEGQIPPPQPNPLGGDTMGQMATPGTDTRGAIAPGTTPNAEMPSTPPTLPAERPPPAPVTSPR